jgi:branched-chain amino acid transport system permease protein
MAYYLIQALNAVSLSVLLMLLALGLSLMLSLMNFINLAHGSFYLLGSYVAIFWLAAGLPWYLALPAAFLAAALAGLILDRYPLGLFYQRTHLMQVLLTYGLSVMFADLMRWGFGAEIMSLPMPDALRGVVFILGLPFPLYRLYVIGVGIVLAFGLWYLVERTLWGAAMRACVSDRRMVETLGIDTRRIFTVAMVVAGGLGGLAGALGGGLLSAYPGLDEEVLLLALLVVVVGGLGNMTGTILSAILMGFITTFARIFLPEFANVISLGAVAAILLIRPDGLFAHKARRV